MGLGRFVRWVRDLGRRCREAEVCGETGAAAGQGSQTWCTMRAAATTRTATATATIVVWWLQWGDGQAKKCAEEKTRRMTKHGECQKRCLVGRRRKAQVCPRRSGQQPAISSGTASTVLFC